ncbi:nuclease [Rhizobium sp. S153]|uniref:Nuclease n=1 Tax=Ciceribacter sichuanensis TaxID=2949647 RepID=A0ABT0V5J8_9HYPH|nr:nuclease [Ciceribacter sp. S153]MCM2399718.1 nuclease [Ciceribacter sp. S153]
MAGTTQMKRAPRKRKKAASRQSSGSVWPWLGALLVVAGGIAAYDNRDKLPAPVLAYLSGKERVQPTALRTEAANKPERKERQTTVNAVAPAEKPKQEAKRSTGPVPPAPVGGATVNQVAAKPAAPDERRTDTVLLGKGFSGKFYFCGTSGLDNCVSSGDTFWYHKTRIALADIIAPATEEARCQQEREKGFAAKVRLRDLLNGGDFEFSSLRGQEAGGARVVARNGRSLGSILVSEGLAKPRMGKQDPWCP